jgi:hypothetical protein
MPMNDNLNALQSGDPALEDLLNNLSPEELESLASQIAQELQGSSQGQDPAITELAQQIEQHLNTLPETSTEGLQAEKAAALNFIKSAAYIEGFINEASGRGLNVSDAVDLYDHSLSQVLDDIRNN